MTWQYDVNAYTGTQTGNDRDDMIKLLREHDGLPNKHPLFVIITAGKGEDSWNPNINGLVDMNLRVYVDEYGFLSVDDADAMSQDGHRKHDTHLGGRRGRQTF